MRFKIPIAEVFLTGVSVWWAIVLFVNANTLSHRLPVYMKSFSLLEDYVWASVFLVAALTKVVGLITLKIWLRKSGLVMSMILYSIITTGYILSDTMLYTGTGVYFLMTVLAWWGYREVKENDESVQ